MLSIAIIELSSRPKIWKLLGENPDLIPQALREVMRYHPRSLSTSRETLEDVELAGFFIPKGEAIFPNIGAAHWNPNFFPNPEIFDINNSLKQISVSNTHSIGQILYTDYFVKESNNRCLDHFVIATK